MYDDTPIKCPICRKNLGTADELPDTCPRCGTTLKDLHAVLAAAKQHQQIGASHAAAGNFTVALQAYTHMQRLHNTPLARKLRIFAAFAANNGQWHQP